MADMLAGELGVSVSEKTPKLPGAGHVAINTLDGFVILRDVPSMAEVPKGTKGAPQDIKEEWLDGALKFGQDSYEKNKICYPLHVGHHDDAGIFKPEFAGYFKPTKRGTMKIDGHDKAVLFCDYKIKKAVFDRIQKGELPYISPEIRNWNKQKLSSIALLDSEPPHFPFPMTTISAVKEDALAVFAAELPKGVSIAKFNDKDVVAFAEFDPLGREKETPTEEKKESKESVKCCGHCMAYEKVTGAKFMADTPNTQAGKPNNNPVDQEGAKPSNPQSGAEVIKMGEDPKMAARFAAMEDRNAALEKRLNERDAADKAKALTDKALVSLRGFQIGEKAKAQLIKFASEGEDKLNAFVETLKEVSAKDSPRTFGDAELSSVSPTDTSVVKFAQMGPDKLEAAARFASEYRILKSHPAGRGMQISEEQYVKFQMNNAENPEGQHWGINFGLDKS